MTEEINLKDSYTLIGCLLHIDSNDIQKQLLCKKKLNKLIAKIECPKKDIFHQEGVVIPHIITQRNSNDNLLYIEQGEDISPSYWGMLSFLNPLGARKAPPIHPVNAPLMATSFRLGIDNLNIVTPKPSSSLVIPKDITTSLVFGGIIGIFKVVLKRGFPLRHMEIDCYIKKLENGLGIAGIILSILTLPYLPVPTIITKCVMSICGAIIYKSAKYLPSFVSERVLTEFSDILLKFLNWTLKLMGCAPIPPKPFCKKICVGRCLNCLDRPRTVMSLNCKHVAFCTLCIDTKKVTHCTCGVKLSSRAYRVLPDGVEKDDLVFCNCKSCVPTETCYVCPANATYLLVYEGDVFAYRCNKHFRDSAAVWYQIPHETSKCLEIIELPNDIPALGPAEM